MMRDLVLPTFSSYFIQYKTFYQHLNLIVLTNAYQWFKILV